MKKFIIGLLAVAVLVTGVAFAFAQKADGGKFKRGFGRHRGGFGMLAEKLNLTDEQKAQAKQIMDASREQMKPLLESMRANRQKLAALTENGQFDEAQVQTLAQEQGNLKAQITVERLRAKSRLFQILTDEQKAQAKQMRDAMKERFKNKAE